jgi:hypothetical protein
MIGLSSRDRHSVLLRAAFALDFVAVAAFGAYFLVTDGRGRSDNGNFFSDLLPDGLAALSLFALLAAGAVAAWSLIRGPNRSALFLIPLVLGVSALVFFLGDLIFPQ